MGVWCKLSFSPCFLLTRCKAHFPGQHLYWTPSVPGSKKHPQLCSCERRCFIRCILRPNRKHSQTLWSLVNPETGYFLRKVDGEMMQDGKKQLFKQPEIVSCLPYPPTSHISKIRWDQKSQGALKKIAVFPVLWELWKYSTHIDS